MTQKNLHNLVHQLVKRHQGQVVADNWCLSVKRLRKCALALGPNFSDRKHWGLTAQDGFTPL